MKLCYLATSISLGYLVRRRRDRTKTDIDAYNSLSIKKDQSLDKLLFQYVIVNTIQKYSLETVPAFSAGRFQVNRNNFVEIFLHLGYEIRACSQTPSSSFLIGLQGRGEGGGEAGLGTVDGGLDADRSIADDKMRTEKMRMGNKLRVTEYRRTRRSKYKSISSGLDNYYIQVASLSVLF